MPAKKKSTTKKTKNAASLSPFRQIHKAVTENIEVSIAIVSVFINIFFLTGFILYHTSPSFQTRVYSYADSRFCSNRKEGISQATYEVTCHTGKFQPYYEKALTDYETVNKLK